MQHLRVAWASRIAQADPLKPLPRVGMRFEHRRFLRADYKTKEVCVITRIAQGVVYYQDTTGSKYKCAIEKWPEHVQAILPDYTASSGLSLAGAISVAEQTMERAGLAGRTIVMPQGHRDDPEYQRALAPIKQWVENILGRSIYNVGTNDYILRENGYPIAVTDGMNSIVTRPETNEMILLHEIAHVINRTQEGSGHDVKFVHLLHDLYAKHLGQAAADQFWLIVSSTTPFLEAQAKRYDSASTTRARR
jgi:hypothetical protein